jgi:hypothetical protein
MPTQGRLVSLATLGVLVALSAGGGVWSALSGPRVADVQLHDAASNTLAAPSFVVTLDATVREALNGSAQPEAQTTSTSERVDYQAPDRVTVNESTKVTPASSQGNTETDLVQIGSSCWEPASEVAQSSAAPACQASDIPMFLSLVGGLDKTSNVTQTSGMYELDAADSKHFILTDFLGGSGGTLTPENAKVQIRIQGSDVVWEHLSFDSTESDPGSPTQTISVTLDLVARISQIGSAPPVLRPKGAPTSTG